MKTDMKQISLKVLLGVTVLALGLSYYLTVTVLPELTDTTMLITAFLIDLSFYLVVLFAINYQLKKGDTPYTAILGKSKLDYKKIIPALSLIVIHFCVIILGAFFLVRLLLLTETGSALSLEFLMETPVSSQLSPLILIFKFIIAVVIGPIVEEVLFRGVLLNKLAVKFGIKKGIVFSLNLYL